MKIAILVHLITDWNTIPLCELEPKMRKYGEHRSSSPNLFS